MLADLTSNISKIEFKIITEEGIRRITSLFSELKREMERIFQGYSVECLYEIKIGKHFYSGPSFQEFENHYQKKYRADSIRIILQAANPQTNLAEAKISLILDRAQESNIGVMGINTNWVNGVFSRFEEILKDLPKRNIVLHNIFFEMTVQLLVATILTILSIFMANKITSGIAAEFSEIYIFIIIFVILSNIWTYTSRGLLNIRNTFYPKVDILKAPRTRIFSTVLIFILLSAAAWAVGYIIEFFISQQS